MLLLTQFFCTVLHEYSTVLCELYHQQNGEILICLLLFQLDCLQVQFPKRKCLDHLIFVPLLVFD